MPEHSNMHIITVNLPESYVVAVDALSGPKGIYPSRSELIRVAVREFLLRELALDLKLPVVEEILVPVHEVVKQIQQNPNDGIVKLPNGKIYHLIQKVGRTSNVNMS
jgi:Arc/MetJ-type ribon-helix-helix transcriptional regulator